MGKKITIKESEFRNIVESNVRKALREIIEAGQDEYSNESFLNGFDQVVQSCVRPYRTYSSVMKEIDSLEDLVGPETNMETDPVVKQLEERHNKCFELLNIVAGKINGYFGYEKVKVEYLHDNPYYNILGCYLLVDEDETADDYYESEFGNNLRESLRTGEPFSKVESKNRQRVHDINTQTAQAQKKSFERDMAALPGANFTSVDNLPKNDSPFKVLGKINLSDKDLNKKRW